MSETKKCSMCNTVKETTEFNKNKRAKDGLKDMCKFCASAYNHLLYFGNRDNVIKRVTKWNNDNRERARGYRKKYKQKAKLA